ncbi:MAG TPA: hypothetical protein VJI96_02995 [Candidatus Andersenbacteria bacterium]|nr:hypothetical protein [Candidatus Andersenbacteria bacterium]
MPQTLIDVVTGDQSGFELRIGYYPQIKHSLMGFFPGIITASNEIILVFERDLIAPIWAMMEPMSSEWVKGLFFVSKEKGIAFSMSSGRLEELSSLKTWQVLSRSNFEELTADGIRPFSWAAGIFGAMIQPDEFERLRKGELEKLVA